MMQFLRNQSQLVLVVVLGVIGLGFLFYGNAGNLLTTATGRASNDYGRIDGEDLSVAQLYDAVRDTRSSLVLNGQAQQLMQQGASQQVAEEAWRRLLLLHEADRLHIYISDRELIDYIKSLPLFQKDGVYSPDIYKSRMAEIQALLRVPSESGVDAAANAQATFERIIRKDLRAEAVRNALFGNIHSSAQDVAEQYQKYYGADTVSYVTFDPKAMAATVQVTPAEIEKEYKDNPTKAAYRTKEKRKVDFVLFSLTPDQMKLPLEQKNKAKDALGDKALDFALAFQPEPSATGGKTPTPPDFQEEAKKRGLTPATTDFFAEDATPANVPPSPAFNNAAYALTKDDTISKVVELDNGVAVLHLDEIQASELRPLDEVKADIQKTLQQTKALQQAELAAKVGAQALQDAVAKGTDFKTAASGMKLKVETMPAFIPFKVPQTDQKLETIAYATMSLKPGQVSGPVPMQADNSVVVIHLDSRATADPAGLADFEKRFRESQDQQARSLAYADWANWMSKQPGTHKPPELDAYGTAE